ncbi:hypothetical protein ACF0H5_020574 [Mactra antiquata]
MNSNTEKNPTTTNLKPIKKEGNVFKRERFIEANVNSIDENTLALRIQSMN